VIANVVSVGIPCMAHAAVFAKHDGDATDYVAVRIMEEIDVFMTLGGGNQDCIISYINDAVLRRIHNITSFHANANIRIIESHKIRCLELEKKSEKNERRCMMPEVEGQDVVQTFL
ncbi:hypothetical protein Tco_1561865, partial [Tanacetum coccineum]